jgi:hypothetical protein
MRNANSLLCYCGHWRRLSPRDPPQATTAVDFVGCLLVWVFEFGARPDCVLSARRVSL